MPIIAGSHFVIDLPTLFAVTMLISATGGLLLLIAWMQNRRTTALALWGIGYLMGAVAAGILGSPAVLPASWSVCIANTFACGAYGMMWGGARSFEGRRIHLPLMAAGAAVWLIASQGGGFAQAVPARIILMSLICATYAFLSARELCYARDPELLSRWPTLALVVAHTGFLLARIPFADALALSAATGHPQSVFISILAFQSLFTTFCLPFLRVAMSKERTELEQRKAALTDTLTGVPNRRAFFERGAALLERALADRRPAALLLFDLDRFKDINDTAGHQAGDRVLKAFSSLATAQIRSGDLFGRLGGEEFACLMPDTSMAEAVHVAERLRREFAGLRVAGVDGNASVSAGVAMAGEQGSTLSALLAVADRALYRAKADGRNRVASAPLVLVETNGRDTVPWSPERSAAFLGSAAS